MKPECCEDWPVQIEKVNGPIVLQSIRAGRDLYDGRPFRFCPWCGTLRADYRPPDPDRVSGQPIQFEPYPQFTWSTIAAILAMILCACSAVQTITPTRVHSQTSSYDASTPEQYPDRTNSGVLALVKDSRGQATHAIVTLNVVERYRALIADYGDQLAPPLAPGEDMPPGCAPFTDQWGNQLFKIDTQNLDRLRQLSLWRKSGRERTGAWARLLNKI